MSKETNINYGNINNPYNASLQRASSVSSSNNVIPTSSGETSSNISTNISSANDGTSVSAETTPTVTPSSVQGNSLTDMFFETWLKSRNYQPKTQGILLDGRTGYLEAQTGNIANWNFTYEEFSSGNVKIQSTAERILMGAATAPLTGIGIFMGLDGSDYEFRAGNPSTEYIHWTGTALNISGSLTAGSISIGTSPNWFRVDTTGNIWLGAATYDIATNPFAVSSAGVLRAVSGTIGGCTLGTTSIGSTSFVSNSAGWNISNTGTAEFENIIARGEFRTAVFVQDEIHANGGSLIILGASTLKADFTSVTTPATSTLDLTDPPSGHTQLFAVNDIIRIKDGSGKDNWLKVTVASDQTTFYRYTVDKQSGTNGTFTAGTAVINYKQSANGHILLTSDATNSPYIDIALNGATPWTASTLDTKVRLGWLQGIVDADVGLNSTDVWGLYTDNAYLKGVIVANTGYIGGTTGWTIAAGSISSINGGNTTILASGGTNAFIAGTTGSPTVSISHAGVLTASSATITGTINATAGYIGTGTTIIIIDSSGLLIGTSGKIRTADSGARLEIIKTIDVNYNNGLQIYDSFEFRTLLLAVSSSLYTLNLFGNDNHSAINITDTDSAGAGGTGTEVGISIQGTQHGLTVNTTGSTSRSEKSCFYANNQSDEGMGFYAKGDTGNINVNTLFYAEPNSTRGNVLEQTAVSYGQISNITNHGYIQYPAYHHRSDFDENISGDTVLASTVLAKAYWDGSGVNGTQTLIDGDFHATYITLATTAVTNSTSILQFHRKLCRSGINSTVEFRFQLDDITNVIINLGLFYDSTHYVYFLFDSSIDAANIYAARDSGAGGETRTDTNQNMAAGQWYHWKIFFNSNGTAYFYQNESLVATVSTDMPTSSNLAPYAYVKTLATENKNLSIDSIEFWNQKNNASSLTD